MIRIVIYIILGVLILPNSGCIKECDNLISNCLLQELEEFKKEICGPNASFEEYYFQGQIVYYEYIGDCCCDYNYKVINSKCVQLGTLGGLAGITEINGVDFFKYAKLLRIVWKQ